MWVEYTIARTSGDRGTQVIGAAGRENRAMWRVRRIAFHALKRRILAFTHKCIEKCDFSHLKRRVKSHSTHTVVKRFFRTYGHFSNVYFDFWYDETYYLHDDPIQTFVYRYKASSVITQRKLFIYHYKASCARKQ